MSRKILCPDCEKELKGLANRYDELFESKEGRATKEMYCDDCGIEILTNETCFACVLLPSPSHFNYANQKPEVWMNEFMTA